MSHLPRLTYPFNTLEFYATGSYPCSYLHDRLSVSEVASPPQLINTEAYSELVRHGFRRSGIFTYRPHCPDCQACVPVRLPVAQFSPNRSQKRNWKSNQHLMVRERALAFSEEHYDLYRRYQNGRHAGGGMDMDDSDQYENFLLQSTVDTCLIEFRDQDALRMVSIIDMLDDGLSSVYTFYDPSLPAAGLGTWNILWQIAQCKLNELPYLYLGYWIKDCRKMQYKSLFRPIEGFIDGQWQPLITTAP